MLGLIIGLIVGWFAADYLHKKGITERDEEIKQLKEQLKQLGWTRPEEIAQDTEDQPK